MLGGVFFLAFVREESEGEEKGGGARAGAGYFYRKCGAPDTGATHEGVAPQWPALLNQGWGPPCHAGSGVAPQAGARWLHVWRPRYGSHTKGLDFEFF